MGKKQSKRESGDAQASGGGAAAEEGKLMIKDPRFSSAHTDPRFRRVSRRESKVTLGSRFQSVLTDKASAPVDKRGKRTRGRSGKDFLKEFYRIDEEEGGKKEKKKKTQQKEEDSQEESSEAESEEESRSDKKLAFELADEESDDEVSEEEESEELSEEDTDESSDDEAIYEDDGPEIPENITNIEKETHRLAIVNMDWKYVSAKDLYVVLNSFVPKDGCILSVAVYPTEFGLERMKEEEIHGPAIDGDKKKEDNGDEDDEEEEEEDEDVINEKLRDYEKSRLK